MLEKLKNLFLKLNEFGIPVPLVHDPNAKAPSVSLTLLIISAIMVFVGLVGKMAKVLDVDLQQSLYWFGMTAALYFGRKFTNKDINISKDDNEKL